MLFKVQGDHEVSLILNLFIDQLLKVTIHDLQCLFLVVVADLAW